MFSTQRAAGSGGGGRDEESRGRQRGTRKVNGGRGQPPHGIIVIIGAGIWEALEAEAVLGVLLYEGGEMGGGDA